MLVARKLFYLGLEPLAARYTKQLCEQWFPSAVKAASPTTQFIPVNVQHTLDDQIHAGVVLDATGRGIYSCLQVAELLAMIRRGEMSNEDVIFLQDFWTPGFEAVPYALHLHGLTGVKIYSMLHAQSVDEYDFTWDMRQWMRPMELGLSRVHAGIFVGSTVHREQLRAAGVDCPIHVIGLPISVRHVGEQMWFESGKQRRNNVVFTSRLDWEKNPSFMLDVAKYFLETHPSWTWTITTSGKCFRSNTTAALEEIMHYGLIEPRFKLRANLTKDEYYEELCTSRIQFNSSLQDYVSWTLLEACVAGCDLVYPNFRSFPEILPADRMYQAFSVRAAVQCLSSLATNGDHKTWMPIAEKCDAGRLIEAEIVCGVRTAGKEVNIWHQAV